MKHLVLAFLFSICHFCIGAKVDAQTNLLLNPDAGAKAERWRAYGQATVEDFDGESVFVLRNKGYFLQDVYLAKASVGKYALLIGRGSSERINADGAITGLPYLYGYMMKSVTAKGSTVIDYLQGQKMRCDARIENQWVTLFGIFQIPEGTEAIRFFLSQAERRNLAQNGSAARFDNVGLYIFETKEEARSFVNAYQ